MTVGMLLLILVGGLLLFSMSGSIIAILRHNEFWDGVLLGFLVFAMIGAIAASVYAIITGWNQPL